MFWALGSPVDMRPWPSKESFSFASRFRVAAGPRGAWADDDRHLFDRPAAGQGSVRRLMIVIREDVSAPTESPACLEVVLDHV